MYTDKRGYSRSINKFPNAYKPYATPYYQDGFSKDTMDIINHDAIPFANVCKTIFIGDVSVGKTTLIHRFCYNIFSDNYKATIGVDFEIENFRIMDWPFNLQIWDTAGQERFRCIAQAYYRNANVIVIVFDMTKADTLYSSPTWLKDALSVNSIKPLLFLVGTKCDLLSRDELFDVESKGIQVAKSIEAEYWSVSAMTGHNIPELFQRIVALSFDDITLQSINENKLNKEMGSSALKLSSSSIRNNNNNNKNSSKRENCTACELM